MKIWRTKKNKERNNTHPRLVFIELRGVPKFNEFLSKAVITSMLVKTNLWATGLLVVIFFVWICLNILE